MPMYNFKELFAARTHCMIFQAQASPCTEESHGWIGGKAPMFFDDKTEAVNRNGIKHYFYLSLVHPFRPERMISVFIPEEYDEYLENNIYPNCSIQVFDHPISKESTSEIYTHPGLIKHSIIGGDLMGDKDSAEQSFLIKLGGTPRLIQDENYYFTGLAEDGFDFLFQVDEDGYPDTLLDGKFSYPFSFGAMYVFAQIISDREFSSPVAGFWQYS
ncbi:hypothetical protein [Paenibacillus faecis]|uniref:hypothetical protein n=1 Tax=Paenibacillus faecis TaxID=862114 RepID=UPI001BCE011A|nr:hypothetical protein [Paenibacillus faecis]